jgi:ElaB/YqjD/DUF883 family membrane-anchored ribosome-binding protein
MANKDAGDANRDDNQPAGSDGIAAQAKRAAEGAAAAAQQARSRLDDARDTAWQVAQRARAQAGGLAEDVYARGGRALEAVRGQVEEQPMIAILAAGILGFVIGYALRRR